ncbi:MAG: hypothetical protein NTY42_00375 [Planctomycetota bacterium]|nr:hypothetical protein [Planctomycetota bacterium]
MPTRTTARELAAYKNASGLVRLGLMMIVRASSATGTADSVASASWAMHGWAAPSNHRPVHTMHWSRKSLVNEKDFIAANMMRTYGNN